MINIAINGYGRIGRLAHRIIINKYSDQIKVAAINGSSGTDIKGWAYLLKYDTVYGPLKNADISWQGNQNHQTENKLGQLIIKPGFRPKTGPSGAQTPEVAAAIPFYSLREPKDLPWQKHQIDVVIESTGKFVTEELAKPHLAAGAKKVLISASSIGGGVETKVIGVNAGQTPESKSAQSEIYSSASCTTNCITPVAAVIASTFGIERAMMTTIHGYTSDQRLQDGSHKDYRRARAAALNIIPTSTGAALAAAQVLPELKGVFNGLAFRVPVAAGSVADFTIITKQEVTLEKVNQAFEQAAKNPRWQNIIAVTADPIVSSDVIGSEYSALVDLSLTQVLDGHMVKIVAWYDNEWAYSNRLVEQALLLGQS